MRKRRTILAVTAGALGLILTACSSPTGTGESSGQPGAGGNLTVLLGDAPDALDPTVAQTYVGRVVLINMCEKLYDIDKDLNIVPSLAAELPKISADGKTYTIKLREGIRFNDGAPFNADAVKTTLQRYIEHPRSSRAESLQAVKSIEVVDDTTVRLQLSEPYAPLTSILAARAGMMLSPKQLEKKGDDFAKDPVCVGPFEFKARPSNTRIELAKSDEYYDKEKVHLDGVTFKVVTQPNVRAANLRSGDADVADRIAPPDVKSLQSSENVELLPVTTLGYQGVTINVSNSGGAGKPPFNTVETPLAKHPELRKALRLSLNRKQINKVVFFGQYEPGCTPISPVSPYATGFPCPPQNLAKAKKLVQQSGVETPIDVELMVQAGDQLAVKLGTVIQSMAKKAGFKVSLKPTEFTTALTQGKAGKFNAFQVGWSGRLDPDQNIAQFWSPSALNYSGANYEDVNKLLDKARSTTDMAKRKEIYQKLSKKFLEYNNIIYLYHEKFVLGHRSEVTGIKYFGDGLIRLKTAAFTGEG